MHEPDRSEINQTLNFLLNFVSGLCCLTLVVWTVIITASPLIDPNEEKGLNITNVTVSAVCPLNASLAIDEVSLALEDFDKDPKAEE